MISIGYHIVHLYWLVLFVPLGTTGVSATPALLSLLTLTRLVTTVKLCLSFGIFDMIFPANVLVSILTGDNSNDNHAGISCSDTFSSPSKKSSPSSNDKNAARVRQAGVTRAVVVSCHLSISSS